MPKPKADTKPVTLRVPQDLLDAIDNWRRTQKDLPSRTEAIRRLVKDRLLEQGAIPMAADVLTD